MKMLAILKALLPLIVLSCIVSILYFVPVNTTLVPSAISPDLPYESELNGWYGQRTQASKEERQVLSKDTKFSKGIYRRCGFAMDSLTSLSDDDGIYAYGPQVSVSIVYSGADMNGSIHRPERCLPSQGHQQLAYSESDIKLPNGKVVTLSKLKSVTVDNQQKMGVVNHVHYYVFVGHCNITHSHVNRTLYDLWYRIFRGRVQSWAYLQIGSSWGDGSGVTEIEAEEAVLELMGCLLERQVDWSVIQN